MSKDLLTKALVKMSSFSIHLGACVCFPILGTCLDRTSFRNLSNGRKFWQQNNWEFQRLRKTQDTSVLNWSMRPANKYHTIFKMWKDTHENHQNYINQIQKRKKSFLTYFFLLYAKSIPSLLTFARAVQRQKAPLTITFHLLDHSWNMQSNIVLFSFCV